MNERAKDMQLSVKSSSVKHFRSLVKGKTNEPREKSANGGLLWNRLVYSTILVKFIWTFGGYRKTQSYALASEVAWPSMV